MLVKFCNLFWGRLDFDAGMGCRARAAWERLALVRPVETITPHLSASAALLFSVHAGFHVEVLHGLNPIFISFDCQRSDEP